MDRFNAWAAAGIVVVAVAGAALSGGVRAFRVGEEVHGGGLSGAGPVSIVAAGELHAERFAGRCGCQSTSYS